MLTNVLPLELVEIVCKKIENDILFEICIKNELLDNLNDILVKKYIDEIGINGLILQGNLAGVKYIVEKGYYNRNIYKNKNYCLKWAKICEKPEIVKYLISCGMDPKLEFDIKSHIIESTPYEVKKFSINVKPIHIDNIANIKCMHIVREFTDPHLRDKFMIDEDLFRGFRIINPYYSGIYMIRNLNIKYSEGNIPLELAMNDLVLYKWNSDEILTQIIPVKDACYCLFKVYSKIFPQSEIPKSEYHKFTIECDICFLPTKCQKFNGYFRYSSGISRYNVSESAYITEKPDPQIFGEGNDKIYNLLYLDAGILRWRGYNFRYGTELVTRNREEIINDYVEYTLEQYEPIKLCGGTFEKLKQNIVMYGELCLPYDIC